MALDSSLFRTGFLILALNKNAAELAWPCNSCCRLSAVCESSCDEDAPTQIFTFGLIQLQPKTAQGITPLSALNCSVVNANKCPGYLLRCDNESSPGWSCGGSCDTPEVTTQIMHADDRPAGVLGLANKES